MASSLLEWTEKGHNVLHQQDAGREAGSCEEGLANLPLSTGSLYSWRSPLAGRHQK